MEGILGLRYGSTELKLFATSGLTWRIEDDILNYDHIGQGHSFAYDIPYEGNAQILEFAGDPVSASNYKTYEGFYITFGSNIWWEAVAVHQDTTTEVISLAFSTVNSAFFDKKNVSIRTLLKDVRWNNIAGNEVAGIRYIDNPYPHFHFYGHQLYFESTVSENSLVVNNSSAYRIPAFYLLDLIKECLFVIGMELNDNLTVAGDDIKKLGLVHNRKQEELNEGQVADYVTDVSLLELIKILTGLTASSLAIGKDISVLEVNDLDRSNARKPVDLRGRINRIIATERPNMQRIKVAYDLSNDDLLQDASVPTGTSLGVYDTVSDFETAASSEGEYAFVLLENCYYQYLTVNSTLTAVRKAMDVEQYESDGEGEAKDFPIGACPTEKRRYVYIEMDVDLEMDENGFFLQLLGWDVDPNGFIDVGDYILAEEDTSGKTLDEPHYEPYYREVTNIITSAGPIYNVRFAATTNNHTEKVTKITIRKELNRYIPVIGAVPYEPLNIKEQGREINVPRVVLLHGTQDDLDSGTYEMASCDNLDSDGNDIGTYTLNTTVKGGMIKHYYDRLAAWIAQTMVVRIFGFFTHKELRDINEQKVILTEKGKIRHKETELEADQRGGREVQIEGYRV